MQHPVVDPSGPALLDPDLLITLASGMRKLDPTEWVKLKGLPKTWRPGPKSLRGVVESMGAQEWSALGDLISTLEASRTPGEDTAPTKASTPRDSGTHESTTAPPKNVPWKWDPPDLGADSPFYKRQLNRLCEVTAELDGPPSWIKEGKAILAAHRENYGPDGPKNVVVLWWNWRRSFVKGPQ
jgi:hypothetical protein